MAGFEALRAKASQLRKSGNIDDDLLRLSEFVPTSFTLAEISQFEENQSEEEDTRPGLLVLLSCLRHGDRIRAEPTDSSAAGELAGVIARSISPISAPPRRGEEGGSMKGGVLDEDPYNRLSGQCSEVAYAGLQALQQIQQHTSAGALANRQVLISLAAFAEGGDSWAREETAALAKVILDQELADSDRESFIVETVLKGYLRALFSKSVPVTITGSGRKAEYRDHDLERERGLPDETGKTKPWKYEDLRAIPAFSWAINHADVELISKNWPLFIPVLLTLLDDPATRVRARGLVLATRFLSKFPSKTLRETGLATVFEQAIFPTLNFLPDLTPEDESVQLLKPTFEALLVLSAKISTGTDPTEGNKLRDKILREGVFMAYFHSKDHIRIVEVLLQQTTALVEELEIHAVKHLKDLIPMFSATITDPFALSYPPALLSAITALQATIANCWPRLSRGIWQDEIIKMLVLGWLHLVDDSTLTSASKQTTDEVQAKLVKAAKMLAAAGETDDTPLAAKVAPLISKEPELAGLFGETR